MALFEKLAEDLKKSMKSGDRFRTDTIRFLLAELQNRKISFKRELEDGECIDAISSQIKKNRESIEGFTKGGRTDLVEKTEKEQLILKEYLPRQLEPEELVKIIEDAIAKTGASVAKDMGKVMGALMPVVKGKADSRLVSELVKERLK